MIIKYTTMNGIPQHLRVNMMILSILLKKKEMGWDKIHWDLTNTNLYLKKEIF